MLNPDDLITHEELTARLDYNPETGVFTWKERRGKVKKGDVAGSINSKGYLVILTASMPYKCHRLAWFYMTKEWPIEVDHINRIKNDNRWCNLRHATRKENSWNVALKKNNTSGYTGVIWNKQHSKWQARVKVNGKLIYLGFFVDKEKASMAYDSYVKEHRGEFCCK